MASNAPLSLNLDDGTFASLRTAAAWRDMSVEDYAKAAIEETTKADAAFAAFVQEGIDSADRGELISQEDMEAWYEDRVAARRRG